MSKENVPFIFGYKTHGLNFITIKKVGNDFIYPKYIPFFGYSSHPDMNIYDSKIVCSEKLLFYNFKILLQNDSNYIENTIELKDYLGNIIYINKDTFFNDYNYNFKTTVCSKKVDYCEAVQMKGMFLCIDNNNPNGYQKGYSGDYLLKKNNTFFIEKEDNFKKNYDIDIVVKEQPRGMKRPREESDVFKSNKKALLEKDRNFYKFIDNIDNSSILNLHMRTITIKLYCPRINYVNNKIELEDYNYKINLEKDIFPKLEIYNKVKDKKKNDIMIEYYVNMGSMIDYSLSWYYYLLSIPKFIFNSIS